MTRWVPKRRLMVSGSRTILDPLFVKKCLDEIKKTFDFDCLIHGGAVGVDMAAGSYADFNKIPVKVFKPEWNKYGKVAGIWRNLEMIKSCDKGIVIWDGSSRGSKHAKYELQRAGKLLKVFYYNGDESKCQDCGSKIILIKYIGDNEGYHYVCSSCHRIYDNNL